VRDNLSLNSGESATCEDVMGGVIAGFDRDDGKSSKYRRFFQEWMSSESATSCSIWIEWAFGSHWQKNGDVAICP
jgi:hypothetical protein